MSINIASQLLINSASAISKTICTFAMINMAKKTIKKTENLVNSLFESNSSSAVSNLCSTFFHGLSTCGYAIMILNPNPISSIIVSIALSAIYSMVNYCVNNTNVIDSASYEEFTNYPVYQIISKIISTLNVEFKSIFENSYSLICRTSNLVTQNVNGIYNRIFQTHTPQTS